MFKHLVILAAGRSSRMWPLTEYVPKAMAIADGKTLLETTVDKYRKHDFRIHLTVGYKADVLAPFALSLGINSVINTTSRGNSWWVYNSILSEIHEPVIVLTCDSLMDINLKQLWENYKKFKEPACLLLPAEPKEGFEGDYIHQKNGLVALLSRKEKSNFYGSGCQVLNLRKIRDITEPAEDFLEVWGQLIAHKQLYCADFAAQNWFTFDTVEQLKLYKSLRDEK